MSIQLDELSFQDFQKRVKGLMHTEYTELDPSNLAEAKSEFLANPELRVPNFRYERKTQSIEYLKGIIHELETLKSNAAKSQQLESYERRLVAQLIKSCHQQTALLLAAGEYRHEPTEAARKKFASCNRARYGEPDRATTLALLNYEIGQLPADRFTEEETQIFQQLLKNLPAREAGTANFFAPRPETITKFEQAIRDHMSPLFKYLPEGLENFTPEEVVAIVNQTIDQEIRPWSKTLFSAEISEEKTALSVDQLERKLYIPRHRAKGDYTRSVVEASVLTHEMLHLFRGVPFEECGVPALSYGLPGYEEAEEGITTACELAIKGGKWEPQNPSYYVNVGLIHFYGEQGYDFRKVFEIRRDLFYLSSVIPESPPEEKALCYRKAVDRAFAEVNRAVRGTGILPYYKDLIYFNGNQKVWRLISEKLEVDGSQAQQYDYICELINILFWCGKTNPLDPEHLKIARNAISGLYGNPSRVPWS